MRRKRTKVSEQVRQAIDTCGRTRYRISHDTGIDQATLCRFVGAKGGLSIPILDTLCEYLKLRVVVEKRRAKKGM